MTEIPLGLFSLTAGISNEIPVFFWLDFQLLEIKATPNQPALADS